ncbi:MAG: molybdopterin-dependent oxidoreductase [candidate division Zixibacteria bacterium]
MSNKDRRTFLKYATLGAAGTILGVEGGSADSPISGKLNLNPDGKDFSLVTKQERKAIPSACWQCLNVDAIIGYVENGRLVKIEGNPAMIKSGGKICARGQAGINQVYNPDRLLYPMKRAGARGEGKWQRITWDDAMDLLVNGGEIAGHQVKGMQTLRDEGTPEKFLFHYGRMTGSDWVVNNLYFLPAYGTGSVGDHNSICVNAGGVDNSYTGQARPSATVKEAKLMVNFGSAILDAGFSFIPDARDFSNALARGMKMYTFDVRLSNTAAKSTEWVPIKPGTDLAVILAMGNVLIEEGLADEAFIRDFTDVSMDELGQHLASYTPEWAESISGVPAKKIRTIATELGTIKPGLVTSKRGLFMHHNGVQAQRALHLLSALAGHISPKGTRGPRAGWDYAFPFPQPAEPPRSLNLFSGEPGKYFFTDWGVSHKIVHMLDQGLDRPEIYLVYCHNPVYSNGDCSHNIKVYKDVEKVPFLVACDVVLSETSELGDLVIPDATYLERWTLESTTANNTPEYYLRQPMHPPLGEARNFIDVVCDLSNQMDIGLGFNSAEELVRETCNNTPGVKEAGGFEYMKANGIWHGEAETSEYDQPPLSFKSEELGAAGFDAIPAWMPIPQHVEMADNELILTTFKVPVQTHSRTQGCKWLTELHHDNPALINSRTAARLGISDGDQVRLKSSAGEMISTAKTIEGIHTRAVAISHHCGHWAWGHYASGKKNFGHTQESDVHNKWWESGRSHVNNIIPCVGDPISGSMCWMDTVVTIEKV